MYSNMSRIALEKKWNILKTNKMEKVNCFDGNDYGGTQNKTINTR